ncbi:P-loop containing nucleoside triphosphate hydrolase protein [Mycena amicta]|nr:P-loop containing nucleoside triphosphate hydrolase protein [Mycena amicta]
MAASGTYRHILCSPEIFNTKAFKTRILNKIAERCRVVNLDEAHCISTWGGSFRPDYLELGDMRGLVPSHVPILLASATWPSNVLDEVRQAVGMPPTTRRIVISNARPNVALSVRATKFEEQSFADLRFLIPADAKKSEDVPITLWARDAGIENPVDGECVAFYHAKVGPKRKQELEAMLAAGKIQILCCTDAVGMGCDMRNIERVVLWELPPSFCALVQRAGRAARDLTKLGEAILIVSKNLISKGGKVLEADLIAAAVEAAANEGEAMNEDEGLDTPVAGVEVNEGREHILVEEGGVRQENESDEEGGEGQVKKSTRGKRARRAKNDCSEREARFLTRFACGKECIAAVWDEFFENGSKEPLQNGVNTLWKPRDDQRCCYRCSPDRFPLEKIALEKTKGLKRGRKKKLPLRLVVMVKKDLKRWRTTLAEELYPGIEGIAAEVVLGDDVIEQIAQFGERIESAEVLRGCTRWHLAYRDVQDHPLSEVGQMLLTRLAQVYADFDALGPDALETGSAPASLFYAAPTRARGGGVGRGSVRGAADVRGGRGGRGRGRGSACGTPSTRGSKTARGRKAAKT